jgi:hypothetical protein
MGVKLPGSGGAERPLGESYGGPGDGGPGSGSEILTETLAALRKGLKDALGVIEALDSMTPASREFETEVLQALRDLLKLKLPPCPACGKRRELTSHCSQHE